MNLKKFVCLFSLVFLFSSAAPALAHYDSNNAPIDVQLYKWLVVSECVSGTCTVGSKAGSACTSDNQCVGYVKGTDITPVTATNDAYSPKATCARSCHIASGDSVDSPGHNYGSGEKLSVHSQGVMESDDMIYWQSYTTKAFEHGVSVGRHMNHGRNEDYPYSTKAAFGDPWFTSSPGMFGKY